MKLSEEMKRKYRRNYNILSDERFDEEECLRVENQIYKLYIPKIEKLEQHKK